ncbi:hypothetical protein NDU88_002474, partial [Pleurodeles waltl]
WSIILSNTARLCVVCPFISYSPQDGKAMMQSWPLHRCIRLHDVRTVVLTSYMVATQ